MSPRNRELHDAIENELAELGCYSVEFGRGGKHEYVEFTVRGVILRHAITTTPSDHRYIKNTIRDLRRHVRERLDKKATACHTKRA